MSMDKLIEKIVEKQNPTVAGLDPKLSYIPEHIRSASYEKYGKTLEGAADALLQFNKGLIDALCDVVPAVKPQAAYYEMYGWQGVKALTETIAYAKSKGMFVITDGKRNDIGATMTAYAAAHLGSTTVEEETFEPFGADALTVNGYLGTDGIQPLLEVCGKGDKGIFVLVKTSNPSSGELQDKPLADGNTVYRAMGAMCEGWGEKLPGQYGYSGVGAVVGATIPPSWKSCGPPCPTPSSWCPATAPRAALPTTWPLALTRTAWALSSTPPGASCAPGRRRAWTARSTPPPPAGKPSACGTKS